MRTHIEQSMIYQSENTASLTLMIVHHGSGYDKETLSPLFAFTGFQIIDQHHSLSSALPDLYSTHVDVVIIYITNPEVISELKLQKLMRRRASLKMLIILDNTVPWHCLNSLDFDASGYLLERDIPTRLVHSLSEIQQGGMPVSSFIIKDVPHGKILHTKFDPENNFKLTRRELECLELLSEGLLYKEIAARLGLNFDTVRSYIRRIFRKLEVQTRTEAAIRYLSSGGWHLR